MKSTKTYFLYEGRKGEPRVHWQNGGKPTVPGCRRGKHEWYAPDPRWMVTGNNVRQACALVHDSETTASRGDGLGIWWDRQEHDFPAPYGADATTHFALEALCRGPTMTLWKTREAAESAQERLDDRGCGGGCWGNHRIVPMRLAEAKRCASRWACQTLGDTEDE